MGVHRVCFTDLQLLLARGSRRWRIKRNVTVPGLSRYAVQRRARLDRGRTVTRGKQPRGRRGGGGRLGVSSVFLTIVGNISRCRTRDSPLAACTHLPLPVPSSLPSAVQSAVNRARSKVYNRTQSHSRVGQRLQYRTTYPVLRNFSSDDTEFSPKRPSCRGHEVSRLSRRRHCADLLPADRPCNAFHSTCLDF